MKTLVTLITFALLGLAARSAEVGVRIRFGLTDDGNTKWDGTVAVSPGKVVSLTGWRFQQDDKVVSANEWKATTRPLTVRRSNQQKKGAAAPAKGKKKAAAAAGGIMADNGVILHLVDVTEASVVTVKTAKGNFDFKLSDIPYGKVIEKLDGAVDIERTAATQSLTSQRTDDDYPAIAVAADGTTYVAYTRYTPGLDRDERARSWEKEPASFDFLATPPGGDQVWLRAVKDGKAGEPVAITAGKGDVYKTAVAIDGGGVVWVFWSENKAWQTKGAAPDFEIWARSFKGGKLSEPVNVSKNEANDVSPVAATDSNGRMWVAWQAVRGKAFSIVARTQTIGGWSDEMRVSTQQGNCWTPAIAASKDGRVAIAWDTYDKGDYDIWVREYDLKAKAKSAQPVANTPMYEARPALAFDGANRLWASWESSGPTWGKDWGAYERETGIGLYRDRQIGLAVLDGGKWLEPDKSHTAALPGARARRGPANLPVRKAGGAEERKAGEEADTTPASAYNNLGRIVADRDGRIWLLARSRQGNFQSPLGTVWLNNACYFDGAKWVGPILLPHSDNLLYNLPAVAAHPQGGIVVAHSSDHRQSRHIIRRAGGGNASLDSDNDPFDNDIFLSRLEMASGAVNASLKPAKQQPLANAKPSADTLKERKEVEAARDYRFTYNSTRLQIIRGEFHRHTEISGDGGNDGPLEDMWRYGMDVAAMDWLGCGDHDNGGGREYTWWLTQKTTDAFRIAGAFEPPFTYERSVRYPEGHRNVVFSYRGVRTLPRLPISDRNVHAPAPDTQMLFKYLRHFDGVCAGHTAATSMGTDWRDWDPKVEPMVEIYQGARQNYERPGAPRSPTADDAIGGWEPLGFINLAFKKGCRMSFQSSSDHGSTHISYALVLAEDNSREALLKAMKARHTYAATDNIIAEYTCKANGRTYMMGDEFTVSAAPKLNVKFTGTAPFAKITLVKDDVEVQMWTPGKSEVDITWVDPSPKAGVTSYYYFRGEQEKQGTESNGELVWASPMWIKFDPQAK
jgi:hypothetical protein